MMEIIKVQRPLNDPNGPWLIHDKNRKHPEVRRPELVTRYLQERMGTDQKAFFMGAWSSVVGWAINDRVEDQDW